MGVALIIAEASTTLALRVTRVRLSRVHRRMRGFQCPCVRTRTLLWVSLRVFVHRGILQLSIINLCLCAIKCLRAFVCVRM